jgi:hypothetical protein
MAMAPVADLLELLDTGTAAEELAVANGKRDALILAVSFHGGRRSACHTMQLHVLSPTRLERPSLRRLPQEILFGPEVLDAGNVSCSLRQLAGK